MSRILGLVLLLIVTSCAFFNKYNNKKFNDTGIIYLEENEAEKDFSSESRKPVSIDRKDDSDNKETASEEKRDFARLEGISYLNYEEQISEIPEQPLQRHRSIETGKASYYAMKFKGKKTASGEKYDPDKFTAAHPTLPFGTKVRVTNLYNRLSVIVKINDRGPFQKSRIIDLSFAAAKRLDMIDSGVCNVVLEVIK